MPIASRYHQSSYAYNSALEDDSLTPVDKTSPSARKLKLGHAAASRLSIKPLDASDEFAAAPLSQVMDVPANVSSKEAIHMQYVSDRAERKVMFQTPETEAPLHDHGEEPPMKKRRFQRRNSKTAAMLFSSMAAIMFDNEQQKSAEDLDDEHTDGGLKIAEDLVRQLKIRRLSSGGADEWKGFQG